MLMALALLAVLLIGLAVGLVWRGSIYVGERKALDRLASQLDAERRLSAATHETVAAMRRAAWEGQRGTSRR